MTTEETKSLYVTQWRAYFQHGIHAPTIVYGVDETEAKKNALAYSRKNNCSLWDWPIEKIVDHVELLG